MKHTPGPWEWDQGDIGNEYPRPYCDVYTGDGDIIIAQVNDRIGAKIGEANARLIAAAPELLGALEAALVYVHSDPAVYPLIYKMKSAIAKAKGEPEGGKTE